MINLKGYISNKDYAFFGDTDHTSVEIAQFMFAASTLEMLAVAGYKHIMLEHHDRADQCYINALADGRLSPEQYLKIRQDLPSDKSHFHEFENAIYVPDSVASEHDSILASATPVAAKLGMKIHFVHGHEGLIDPAKQMRFFFLKSTRNKAWLEFALAHPLFFENPEQLVFDIIDTHKDRYARQNIDLEKTLLWDRRLTPEQRVYGFWNIEFGHANDKKEMQRLAPKTITFDEGGNLSEFTLRAIFARQKQDKNVRAYIDKLRQGEPAAVLYGAAHIRNKFGGFTAGLRPEQFACVHLLGDRMYDSAYAEMLQDIISDGDLVVAVGTNPPAQNLFDMERVIVRSSRSFNL